MNWTPATYENLAAQYLSGLEDRLQHVRTVANLAGRAFGDDVIVSAAWLHDIGYAAELSHTGMHAIDGAAFLDREGAPIEVVSLVAFHTGAEYEAEERGLMDKLIQFDRPSQGQLDALILADLVTGPQGQRMTVKQRLNEIELRYEHQHPVYRAIIRSRGYLEQCASRAADRIGYPM